MRVVKHSSQYTVFLNMEAIMANRSTNTKTLQSNQPGASKMDLVIDIETIQEASNTADYIRGIVDPLQKLAARNDLEVLSYLLRMVEEEASSAVNSGKSIVK